MGCIAAGWVADLHSAVIGSTCNKLYSLLWGRLSPEQDLIAGKHSHARWLRLSCPAGERCLGTAHVAVPACACWG